MGDQVSNRYYSIRLMFGLNVGIPLSNILKIVESFEGDKTFGDGFRGEELSVARKPIHPVHFASEVDILLANILNHVDSMLVDKSLHKRPYLAHLLRDDRHSVTIKGCLAAPLEWYAIHVLHIDKLLLNDRHLCAKCFLFVQQT